MAVLPLFQKSNSSLQWGWKRDSLAGLLRPYRLDEPIISKPRLGAKGRLLSALWFSSQMPVLSDHWGNGWLLSPWGAGSKSNSTRSGGGVSVGCGRVENAGSRQEALPLLADQH